MLTTEYIIEVEEVFCIMIKDDSFALNEITIIKYNPKNVIDRIIIELMVVIVKIL